MSTRIGHSVAQSWNHVTKQTFTLVLNTPTRVIEANKMRITYRIYASPGNAGQVFIGPDSLVTSANTLDVVNPGEVFEDTGENECYQGDVYLYVVAANGTVIVEEVVLMER